MSGSGVHTRRARDIAVATLAGVTVLVATSVLPNVHLFDVHQGGDTAVYATYGERMASGELPYSDFYVEYPPGALPVFLAPTIGAKHDFSQHSKYLQWALAMITVLFVSITLALLGADRRRLFTGTVLVGLAPVALGYVTFTRYDWWPAALTAAALAALVAGRARTGHAVLAAAVSAKIYPAALVPLTLAHVWRTRSRRQAIVAAAWLVAVLAVIVLPLATIAPGGVGDSLYVQFKRPLQIESLGATVIHLAHNLGLYTPRVVSGSGSDNFAGTLPNAIAAVTSLTALVGLVGLYLLFARTRRTDQQLVNACVAAVLAYLVLGKVLSPQYVIWIVPLVPLLSGRIRLPAAALMLITLILTQSYFQFRYHKIKELERITWVLIARNAVLLALLVVVAVAVVRELLGSTEAQPEEAAAAEAPAAAGRT